MLIISAVAQELNDLVADVIAWLHQLVGAV